MFARLPSLLSKSRTVYSNSRNLHFTPPKPSLLPFRFTSLKQTQFKPHPHRFLTTKPPSPTPPPIPPKTGSTKPSAPPPPPPIPPKTGVLSPPPKPPLLIPPTASQPPLPAPEGPLNHLKDQILHDFPHTIREAAEAAVTDFQHRTKQLSDEKRWNLLAVTFVSVTVVITLFGRKMFQSIKDTTAEVTGEVIAHESMQIKTSELAAAVVAHVLNDEGVMVKASSFIKQASTNEETQTALISLTTKVLQSPEVLKEVNILVKKLFKELLDDPETTKQTANMLSKAMQDETIKKVITDLVVLLFSDPAVIVAATKMISQLGTEPSIQAASSQIMLDGTHNLMNDTGILDHTKEFVADVVADEAIQRTSGDALWNTVAYSVKPGFVAILAGTGMVFLGVGIFALSKGGYFEVGGPGFDDLFLSEFGFGDFWAREYSMKDMTANLNMKNMNMNMSMHMTSIWNFNTRCLEYSVSGVSKGWSWAVVWTGRCVSGVSKYTVEWMGGVVRGLGRVVGRWVGWGNKRQPAANNGGDGGGG